MVFLRSTNNNIDQNSNNKMNFESKTYALVVMSVNLLVHVPLFLSKILKMRICGVMSFTT